MTTPEEQWKRHLESSKRWRDRNREQVHEINRRWYEEHGGKEKQKEWYQENHEHVIEYHHQYASKNRKKINESRRIENITPDQYHRRRAYMLEYQRDYRKRMSKLTREEIEAKKIDAKKRREERRNKDAERVKEKESKRKAERHLKNIRHKIGTLLRVRTRIAIVKQKAHKRMRLKEWLGCSIDFFLKYIESLFKPGMTMELLLAGKIHIDHIKPCIMFDLSKLDEQKACFHYTNMKPEWPEINRSKGARWIG